MTLPDNRLGSALYNSFWPLATAALVLLIIGIGLRDPWPADEPRFALIAKEMVDTGQWFFPARAQELYPDKPPIFMWIIAIFYWLSDSIRISFLLPSALSGLLTLFLVCDISQRLWNKQTAIIAGWMLLFSFQFILQAKTAQIDAMVCAWITVACYGLLRYLLIDGKYKWYALAWFFMGIGVITKGVGFLPLLMLIPYWIYRVKAKDTTHIAQHASYYWILGPLIMLLAIALWFIPMLIIVAQSDNPAFEMYRDNILFKQTVTRYADSWHHIKPFWYYLVSVIPIFWFPVSFLIPSLVKQWTDSFKQLDPRIILPLGWVLLVILFFSISPGKRGVYVLPALPMLVLACAPYYQVLLKNKVLKFTILGVALLLSSLLFITAVAGLAEIEATLKLVEKFKVNPWNFFLVIGIASLLSIAAVWRKNQWLAWPLFMSILWLGYSTYGYYLRNPISTPISVYRNAEAVLSEDAEIALVDFSEQFILFSPFTIRHFGYRTLLEQQLETAYQWQKKDTQFILIEDKLVDDVCFDINKGIDLGFAHRRHWVLLPKAAKNSNCNHESSHLPVYKYEPK